MMGRCGLVALSMAVSAIRPGWCDGSEQIASPVSIRYEVLAMDVFLAIGTQLYVLCSITGPSFCRDEQHGTERVLQ